MNIIKLTSVATCDVCQAQMPIGTLCLGVKSCCGACDRCVCTDCLEKAAANISLGITS